MIELNEVDGFRLNKTSVMLDQVTHVSEYSDGRYGQCKITFVNGTYIIVAETVDAVSARIRAYAETAQRERVGALVADEVAKFLSQSLGNIGSVKI